MARVKRVMVSITEDESNRVKKVSEQIFARVNISATLSYIIKQFEIYKEREREEKEANK